MLNVIFGMPLWLMGITAVLVPVVISVAGVWLVARLGWRLAPEDNETAGYRHAFVSVLYAVALALIVVAVHERHGLVEQSVLDEANAIGDLYRTFDEMPPGVREPLQQRLIEYLTTEVNSEWAILRRGGTSEQAWTRIDNLMRHLERLEPTDKREERAQNHALTQAQRLLDARRTRLFMGQQGVGRVAWVAIIVGAVITLGFACFFSGPNVRAHMLMMAMAGAMFGVMLFFLVALDRPLRGPYGVEPTDLQQQLTVIERMGKERP